MSATDHTVPPELTVIVQATATLRAIGALLDEAGIPDGDLLARVQALAKELRTVEQALYENSAPDFDDRVKTRGDQLNALIGHWQQEIYGTIREMVPYPDRIDGSGSDAGPLELTLAEVSQGLGQLLDRLAEVEGERDAARAEVERLRSERDNPEINDFLEGVRREAAHQRARWGSDHDTGKTDADWFWLIGYLAGKALHKSEKRLHHLITTAAALFNWHLHTLGKTDMRPGIDSGEAQTNS
jgi:DNA repair exonuclease SbcCD ATPase subunit